MNEAELFDQYLDRLRRDLNAAPPPGLDADTAAFIRALAATERKPAPTINLKDRVWHKARMGAEAPSDSFNNRPSSTQNTGDQHLRVLKPNERIHMEDDDMNSTTSLLLPTSRVAPGTRAPSIRYVWQYTLTIAAAVLIVVLIGGILIEMVNDPIEGYPALVSLQTEVPPCSMETDDPQAESKRLAEAAMALLQTRPLDRTPEMVEQGALLAACALRTAQTPEADAALQLAMVTLEIVPVFPGHNSEVNSAVFSPDGNEILIAGNDGVHLWDIVTRSEVRTFPPDSPSQSHWAVFSPDRKYILALIEGAGISLWNTETGAMVRNFDTGTLITRLSYSPDGMRAAFGTIDGSVQIWNINESILEQTLQVHSDDVQGLAFSPDGKALLVGGDRTQNEVHLVNVETSVQQAFVGLRDFSNDVAFSPDGQYVLAGGDTSDRRALLWDTNTGEQVHIFSGFINDINAVAFSPDSRYALVGSADTSARIFDVESGEEVRRFSRNKSFIGSVAFSPDGRTVLIGIIGNDVRLWPVSIEDTIALACSKMTRDFTSEEREEFGLGEGAVCPS